MSYLLYNIVMKLGKLLFFFFNYTTCSSHSSKLRKFISEQHNILRNIKEAINDCHKEKIWVHIASLGEYAVARPLINQLQSNKIEVVLTIFSPSAYEVLANNSFDEKDVNYVFYLPWDTHDNVKQFLDIVNPVKAVFIISEYWINYLKELGCRQIPTYFISSLIPDNSYLLKWYAKPIRKAIPSYAHFMVLDENSKGNLNQIGFENVEVMGNPLFDNALSIAHMSYSNEIIDRFCATAADGVLIAGSISDSKDLMIVSKFANTHRNIKCIFVPHEISEEKLHEIKYHIDGWAELYSDCTKETDFSKRQVLIIDFMGALARIYRYGTWAYVGGGFTPYLHSVIEPIVYGVPVAFGPCIQRKITPQQMINLGIGKTVKTAKEFSLWIDYLSSNKKEMERIKQVALEYAINNSGSTKRIAQTIKGEQ